MRAPSPRSRILPWAAWWAAVLLLVSWRPHSSCGNELFRRHSTSKCGETVRTHNVLSLLGCASLCNMDTRCRGFSIGPQMEDGRLPCEFAYYLDFPYSYNYVCYVNHTTHEIANGIDRGTRGLTALAFIWALDSDLSDYTYLTYYVAYYVPPTVNSVIYADGEKCPDPDQVFVSVDWAGTEKSQRLLCSAIVPPLQLTTDCYPVTIGALPKPNWTTVDTTTWINWIVCDYGYLTEVYWYSDPSAPSTPYRYTGGKCCDTITL